MHSFTDFLRIVFYPAWGSGVSSRQGTSRKSFLSGMGRWQIIVAGNCTRMVFYSTWGMGIHSDRKLFANGFPFGMGQWYIIAAGNY